MQELDTNSHNDMAEKPWSVAIPSIIIHPYTSIIHFTILLASIQQKFQLNFQLKLKNGKLVCHGAPCTSDNWANASANLIN